MQITLIHLNYCYFIHFSLVRLNNFRLLHCNHAMAAIHHLIFNHVLKYFKYLDYFSLKSLFINNNFTLQFDNFSLLFDPYIRMYFPFIKFIDFLK